MVSTLRPSLTERQQLHRKGCNGARDNRRQFGVSAIASKAAPRAPAMGCSPHPASVLKQIRLPGIYGRHNRIDEETLLVDRSEAHGDHHGIALPQGHRKVI